MKVSECNVFKENYYGDLNDIYGRDNETRKEIILNAISWANGEEHSYINEFDIVVIMDYLNMETVPEKFFGNFNLIDDDGNIEINGHEKIVNNTINKILNKLRTKKYNTLIED